MQSQLVCSGCRSLLLYPRDASSVCCAICNTITSAAPPPGLDVAQLVCGGCRTLLVYSHGAPRVQCSCCNTINMVRTVAHVNCGQCHTLLMYPNGAPSVKCVICQFVTSVAMNSMRLPVPMQRTNGNTLAPPSTSAPTTHPQNQTVVVENPMSMDESGKLVSNVVVGVTTAKK